MYGWESSPQKPLGQLQPNFGGMVLGWPPSKFVSVISTSNQDDRQAKNRNFFKWPRLLYFKPESAQI
jgi:hypothetical protein